MANITIIIIIVSNEKETRKENKSMGGIYVPIAAY